MLESTGSHGRGVEWRVPEMRCLALTMTTTDTSSSAIAEAMRCFVCVSSINCTIRRAQVPLQIYGCVQLNSVLFSSSRSTTLVVLNTDSLMCSQCGKLHCPPSQLLFALQQPSIDTELFIQNCDCAYSTCIQRPR